MKSNQLFYNLSHADIHKANWKVRKVNDRYGLVIYDLGFCWKLSTSDEMKYNFILVQAFTGSDEHDKNENDINKDFIEVITFIIHDESAKTKEYVKNYIYENYDKKGLYIECDAVEVFRLITTISKNVSILLDPLYAQIIITLIQTYQYFNTYDINNSQKLTRTKYRYYRGKYLDMLALCKTYNTFPEFKQYIIDDLTKQNVEVDELFDTLDMANIPNSIKHLVKFD